jgi:hypothetical protein
MTETNCHRLFTIIRRIHQHKPGRRVPRFVWYQPYFWFDAKHMTRLHRLECVSCCLRVDGTVHFNPAKQTQKQLILGGCAAPGDDGICLVADALVGNTSMELLLNITANRVADSMSAAAQKDKTLVRCNNA